jgi:hypothetical protein
MLLSDRARRLLLLGLLAVLAAGVVYEQAHANDLDAACGNVCKEECAAAGGCRYFASFGCNCKFQCFDGAEGLRICMSPR